jgi:hypothetical protein
MQVNEETPLLLHGQQQQPKQTEQNHSFNTLTNNGIHHNSVKNNNSGNNSATTNSIAAAAAAHDEEDVEDENEATYCPTSTTIHTLSERITEVKDELYDVLQEDVITPSQPRNEGQHSYKLSAVALAVMVFYKVSGGPFGCEPTVKAAGPYYALLGFIFFPLLWSIPEAFITAELGSAYPEPSGRTLLCFTFAFV